MLSVTGKKRSKLIQQATQDNQARIFEAETRCVTSLDKRLSACTPSCHSQHLLLHAEALVAVHARLLERTAQQKKKQ